MAAEMGTGKTLAALWLIRCLGRHNCYTALVITPKSVCDNWEAEQHHLFYQPPDVSDFYTSRGASEHDRVFVVRKRLTWNQLRELMS